MLRTFMFERAKWDELTQIDTENGQVKIYAVDKELGFPFSEYYTTVVEMGYNSMNAIIAHMKSVKKEVETDKQKAKEVEGLLKLAKYRAENNRHSCILLYSGKRFDDIVERLMAYDMDEVEATSRLKCCVGR